MNFSCDLQYDPFFHLTFVQNELPLPTQFHHSLAPVCLDELDVCVYSFTSWLFTGKNRLQSSAEVHCL